MAARRECRRSRMIAAAAIHRPRHCLIRFSKPNKNPYAVEFFGFVGAAVPTSCRHRQRCTLGRKDSRSCTRPVVVDLVDTEVAFEKRCHKHKWRNESPPEACDSVVFAGRSFGLVSARRTSGTDCSAIVGQAQTRSKRISSRFRLHRLRSVGMKSLGRIAATTSVLRVLNAPLLPTDSLTCFSPAT